MMLSPSHTLVQAPVLSHNPKHGSHSHCCPPFISSVAVHGFCRSLPGSCSVRSRRIPSIRAAVSAQPFDYEAQPEKLKVAILGYGDYGFFIASDIAQQGHPILVYCPPFYPGTVKSIGASFFSDPHELFQQHPDVVVLCTSIKYIETVLHSLPFHSLPSSTLIVSAVLSDEVFPRNLLLQCLPPDFDILCRKDGSTDLRPDFDKVRIGSSDARQKRCDRFLEIFQN